MADEQKKTNRNPYADTGLMIAVAIIIVMVIKCCIFDITWESCFWFILAVGYCIVSYMYDSQSKVVKHSTTGLLVISVIAAVAFTIIDRKPQPKMHAFEQAAKDTTATEEEFILKEEPVLPELEKGKTTPSDTLMSAVDASSEEQDSQSEQQEPSVESETETTEEAI